MGQTGSIFNFYFQNNLIGAEDNLIFSDENQFVQMTINFFLITN